MQNATGSNNTAATSSKFYVVRVVDTFGDTWPLGRPTAGIDGVEYATVELAKAAVELLKQSKAQRSALRERNGWQKGTLRSVMVCEVIFGTK